MKLPRWDDVRAWISAAGGLVAAAAVLYLGLVGNDLVGGNDGWQLASLVAIAAIAIVSSFARSFGVVRARRVEARRRFVAKALRALPWAVHDLTDGAVPVPVLGASAWRIRSVGPFHRLRRVARERVKDEPGPSGITWTRGKGVVGRCWAQGRMQVVDVDDLWSSYLDCDEPTWELAPEDVRMELTFAEFQRIRGKYGTVVAAPVFDEDENMIGCVTLDAPFGHHDALKQDRVLSEVAVTARTVGALLQ